MQREAKATKSGRGTGTHTHPITDKHKKSVL